MNEHFFESGRSLKTETALKQTVICIKNYSDGPRLTMCGLYTNLEGRESYELTPPIYHDSKTVQFNSFY